LAISDTRPKSARTVDAARSPLTVILGVIQVRGSTGAGLRRQQEKNDREFERRINHAGFEVRK
jgi:hypothetical protein